MNHTVRDNKLHVFVSRQLRAVGGGVRQHWTPVRRMLCIVLLVSAGYYVFVFFAYLAGPRLRRAFRERERERERERLFERETEHLCLRQLTHGIGEGPR